jgi:hypothetical protein
MNVSDGARVPLMAVIPILFWTGHLSFPAIVILGFVARSRRVPVDETSRGIFAGLRYVVRDKILGPTLYVAAGIR